MRWVAALCIAGCSFESSTTPPMPDGPDPDVDTDGDGLLDAVDNCPQISNVMQRDWDNDKHGDECDGCPFIASTPDPDADGDHVGDACDPRPALPGDQRLYWLPFYEASEITPWMTTSPSSWAVADGKLSATANALAFLDSPAAHGDVYFATEVEVVNPASYEIGFCGGEINMGEQYYCCAVTNNPAKSARAVSGWLGQTQLSMPVAFPGSLDIGARVSIVGQMSASANACTFTQGGMMVTSSTPRGPQRSGTASFYSATKAHYHYIFVVSVGS